MHSFVTSNVTLFPLIVLVFCVIGIPSLSERLNERRLCILVFKYGVPFFLGSMGRTNRLQSYIFSCFHIINER